MARGKRNLPLETQLEQITQNIAAMEENLVELKKAKNEIEEQIRMNQLAELNDLISEKGLSFEQVKELLNKE
ncbi:MAG: hypothetical protein E7260_09555 [Lachnospiraceae bacterium]|nr:hypothetical protein [Lachnospiraceae bacterium]